MILYNVYIVSIHFKYCFKNSDTETSILVCDKTKKTDNEHWMILDGGKKELKYPKPLEVGHEYFVQIHVVKTENHEGIQFKHKICEPILKKTFRAGRNYVIE